jgi:pimeloyl-ACP methyl ester carboxylesterase
MNTMTLRASQTSIAYADEGAGPILLLLHAFPLDARMWAPQIEALEHRYRIIALDYPGFGGSVVSAGMTIDSIADVAAELLDHLGINERVFVGGLSMGGYVALAFARLYPQRLRALILADTKAQPDDEAGRAGRDKLIELATREGIGALADQLLPKLLGSSTRTSKPDVVRLVRSICERQSIDGVVSALKALRDRPDAGPTLPHISVPTLVIVGEEDAITPIEHARSFAAAIPDPRLTVIPRTGHLSNLEDPGAFNHAVGEFLQSVPDQVALARTV